MKKSRISLVMTVLFAMFLFVSMTFAANDNILSQNIKEADGTSGQNTNSGSGVKTDHIQDGAVTANKIADVGVTTPKLADGATTSQKIADGAITTQKIVDGAITDGKITGPISASKISSVGLNADTVDGLHAVDLAPVVHTHSQADVSGLTSALDQKSEVTHNHDDVYQKKYAGVAVVAKSGGDYTEPVSAMNDLAMWCGTPSATNPCLLKIMPGIYDIGGNTLMMQSYVDVEGSGENITKILGNNLNYNGVVRDNIVVPGQTAELRYLTVENSGGDGSVLAVFIRGIKLTNVTVISYGGYGSNVGIDVRGGTTMTNVTVTSSGGSGGAVGVYSEGSSLSLINATITADSGDSRALWFNSSTISVTNGIVNAPALFFGVSFYMMGNSTVTIKDSEINSGFYLFSSGLTSVNVVNSKLVSPLISNGNFIAKCIGAYDGSYNPIVCQ